MPRATPNSGKPLFSLAPVFSVFLVFLCCGTFVFCAYPSEEAEQARTKFEDAQKAFNQQPKNLELAWKFARACFDLAEFSTTKDERASLAQQGVDACQQALVTDTNSAPSHYYLGLNFGQLARTRSFGALKLVDQMEHEFTTAARLDASFDFGGPDRSLGLLYRDAPTIISIGNRSKSREHLRKAVELAPEYPENRLNLIESYLKWGDRAGARRELTALEQIWPKAKEKFTGPAWSSTWVGWEAQLQTMKKKVEESAKLESPRH